LDEIVTHEQIHCRQAHTIDILLAETLVCLCWFNPVAWLLRRDLKQNLEFLTDRMTLQSGFDRKRYQYNLLRVSGGAYYIVNHFNFHFNHLKKRIIMINKKKSPRIMAVKYLLVVPALAAVLLTVQTSGLQARKTDSVSSIDEISVEDVFADTEINESINQEITKVTENKKTVTVAVTNPDLGALAQTPDKRISGTVTNADGQPLPGVAVFVKETTTGTVTDMNGKYSLNVPTDAILQFSYVGVDTQEIIVGNQQLINVMMATQPKGEVADVGASIRIRGNAEISEENTPLIIIDGKEVNVNVNSINPNQIQSIDVFKNEVAIAKYGEKGKNGVILITMKTTADATGKHVSGTVTNADGQLLPSVAVIVKETTTGTVTDMNGRYSLLNIPTDATLQFSMFGMATQEIALENRQVIDVVMAVQPKAEVADVGTSTKEVVVVGYSTRIKGNAGISDTPLIIVDGKEFDDGLNSIDPKQIESLSVLKGASATAVYGEKGKNGVILITTKK
jgi:TonB-dependent SusC/RagA subfamily outer membrane receptor